MPLSATSSSLSVSEYHARAAERHAAKAVVARPAVPPYFVNAGSVGNIVEHDTRCKRARRHGAREERTARRRAHRRRIDAISAHRDQLVAGAARPHRVVRIVHAERIAARRARCWPAAVGTARRARAPEVHAIRRRQRRHERRLIGRATLRLEPSDDAIRATGELAADGESALRGCQLRCRERCIQLAVSRAIKVRELADSVIRSSPPWRRRDRRC